MFFNSRKLFVHLNVLTLTEITILISSLKKNILYFFPPKKGFSTINASKLVFFQSIWFSKYWWNYANLVGKYFDQLSLNSASCQTAESSHRAVSRLADSCNITKVKYFGSDNFSLKRYFNIKVNQLVLVNFFLTITKFSYKLFSDFKCRCSFLWGSYRIPHSGVVPPPLSYTPLSSSHYILPFT